MDRRHRCPCCEDGTLYTGHKNEMVETEVDGQSVLAEAIPYMVCDLCETWFVTSETLKARVKATDDHQAKVQEAKELFRKNLSRNA